jgi:hypothetical protein
MCPLRRVEDGRAGPAALGILVPPGRRTFLIVRPRSLALDLVLLSEAGGHTFRVLGETEAIAAVRVLVLALEKGAGGHIAPLPAPEGDGYWVRADVGGFALLACARHPGKPYQPLLFPNEAAVRAAAELAAILCPPPGVDQELYVNTRNFSP